MWEVMGAQPERAPSRLRRQSPTPASGDCDDHCDQRDGSDTSDNRDHRDQSNEQGRRMARLRDVRDATGRRLFARGAIPRRRVERAERYHEPVPYGVLGENHPHEPLSTSEVLGGWWRWRRHAVRWEQLEDLGGDARDDIKRVRKFGVSSSNSAMVGVVQFGFQVPPVIAVDRTVCRDEIEALSITVIDSFANQGLGPEHSEDVASALVSAALVKVWDYEDSRTPDLAGATPLARMRAPDRVARMQHRVDWLCLRRGRAVSWDDWVVLSEQRGAKALPNQGTATRLLAGGLRGGPGAFPRVPECFRPLMPPEGMSLPPLMAWTFFANVIVGTDERVAWAVSAAGRGGDRQAAEATRRKQRRWTKVVRVELAASILHAAAMELRRNDRVPLVGDKLLELVRQEIPASLLGLDMREALSMRVGDALQWLVDAQQVPERRWIKIHHFLAEEVTAYAPRAAIETSRARAQEATALVC